jgi:hypothetical protein
LAQPSASTTAFIAAGTAAAQALEADARVGQQRIEHAPGERAVRAAALQRED